MEFSSSDFSRGACYLLRMVREHWQTYAITYRGRMTAHIIPAGPMEIEEDMPTGMAGIAELFKFIQVVNTAHSEAREISISEFRKPIGHVVRQACERREIYGITYRGRVCARLVPVETPELQEGQASAVWANMDELAREISAEWPAEVYATEAVAQQRREL